MHVGVTETRSRAPHSFPSFLEKEKARQKKMEGKYTQKFNKNGPLLQFTSMGQIWQST
jgi:hypothetical protein